MARKKGTLDIIHFMNLSVMNFVELLKIVLISHVLGMAMLSNIHSQEEVRGHSQTKFTAMGGRRFMKFQRY